jgi:hypothetical protein
MDRTDLIAAVIVAVLTGAGGRVLTRRRQPAPWIMIGVGFAAAVVGSLVAGAVAIGDSPGSECRIAQSNGVGGVTGRPRRTVRVVHREWKDTFGRDLWDGAGVILRS